MDSQIGDQRRSLRALVRPSSGSIFDMTMGETQATPWLFPMASVAAQAGAAQ